MAQLDADRSEHRRNWESVRTVLQTLILLGICYLANSSKANSDSNIEMKAQFGTVVEEIKALRIQMESMQTLSRDLAKHDVRLDEHDRRIGTLEQARVHEALRGSK